MLHPSSMKCWLSWKLSDALEVLDTLVASIGLSVALLITLIDVDADRLDTLGTSDAFDVLEALDVLEAFDALDVLDALEALDVLEALEVLEALDALETFNA